MPKIDVLYALGMQTISRKTRWIAYGSLSLSMALVGSYVALSKPLVAALPVFLLAWLRFGIASVAMAGWLRRNAGEPAMSAGTRRLVFLESFFGNFLFSICMLFGVSHSSAVSAGVIMASIPAMVACLSWLMLGERLSARILMAAGLGFAGIGLLACTRASGSTQTGVVADPDAWPDWLGNLLVFAAVLCEAIYAVIGKKLSGLLSPRRISALINLWGLLLMTPLGLYSAWHFDFYSVAPGNWWLLLFYSLAASVWTVWLWMSGLRHVSAAQAGIFTVMLPISAALVGVLALGETLDGRQMLAFGLALCGVLLATRAPAQTSALADTTMPSSSA